MKRQKYITTALSLLLCVCIVLTPLHVSAETFDKGGMYRANKVQLVLNMLGVVTNPAKWSIDEIYEMFQQYYCEKNAILDSDSWEEYWNNHVSYSGEETDEDTEVTFDEQFVKDVKDFATDFINDNSIKYRILHTTDFRLMTPSSFASKEQYEKAQSFFGSHSNDLIFMVSSRFFYAVDVSCVEFWALTDVDSSYLDRSINKSVYVKNATPFDTNWNNLYSNLCNQYSSSFIWSDDKCDYIENTSNHFDGDTYSKCLHVLTKEETTKSYIPINSTNLASYKGGKDLMVFITKENAIDYITNTSDVYVTSNFYNDNTISYKTNVYTITNNNPTTTYNTVYNNITNYYTSGGSYGDGQVQTIIDDTVKDCTQTQTPPSNNNGGSVSGGDTSGSGGISLGGLLSGLGSFLESILNIVGLIIEYIGKAVVMLTDTLLDLADKIPHGITDFLTAVFPFVPQEIFIPIELMLALSVILLVIKKIGG